MLNVKNVVYYFMFIGSVLNYNLGIYGLHLQGFDGFLIKEFPIYASFAFLFAFLRKESSSKSRNEFFISYILEVASFISLSYFFVAYMPDELIKMAEAFEGFILASSEDLVSVIAIVVVMYPLFYFSMNQKYNDPKFIKVIRKTLA